MPAVRFPAESKHRTPRGDLIYYLSHSKLKEIRQRLPRCAPKTVGILLIGVRNTQLHNSILALVQRRQWEIYNAGYHWRCPVERERSLCVCVMGSVCLFVGSFVPLADRLAPFLHGHASAVSLALCCVCCCYALDGRTDDSIIKG